MNIRTTRDGRVIATNTAGAEREIGYVDRHDQTGRPSRTWRGIRPGGNSAHGFPRRADAIAWLLGNH